MKTLVIGDVHGCFETLEALLERCAYEPGHDRLWFTGDLVNRGPRSLDVVRFVAGLGDDAVCVLGNHDAHLLARSRGLRPERADDTFDDVLSAPDRDALLSWLRRRPLLHREGDVVLVHAGLLSSWTIDEAERRARAVEAALADDDGLEAVVSRGRARREGGRDAGHARQRAAFAAMTRLRACTPDGEPVYGVTVAPEDLEPPLVPWFDVPNRRSAGTTIVFGHWAALGARCGAGWIGLDAGCAWGRELAALHLEERRTITVPCVDRRP